MTGVDPHPTGGLVDDVFATGSLLPAPAATVAPAVQRGRPRSVVIGAAAVCGLLLTGALIMGRTQAAFTAKTDNTGNSWLAGTVTLADDDTGAALFTATDLLPGSNGSACIRVTYTGNVAATVKLFVASSAGSMAPYVNLVIEQGAGGGNVGGSAGCGGFAGATLYTGTLASLASAATGHSTGLGTFAPSSNGEFAVYRISYTLDAATPTAQQGESATAAFTWESRT